MTLSNIGIGGLSDFFGRMVRGLPLPTLDYPHEIDRMTAMITAGLSMEDQSLRNEILAGSMAVPGLATAFDTETTGLDKDLDSIIEIGAVRIRDGIVVMKPDGTPDVFHRYIRPQNMDQAKDRLARKYARMASGAFSVHGISMSFLRDCPTFEEIAPDFLRFVGDGWMIAHNGLFDLGFLNAEIARCSRHTLSGPAGSGPAGSRSADEVLAGIGDGAGGLAGEGGGSKDFLSPDRLIDTLAIARRKFPGARATLDSLCLRFNVGLEGRKLHGALVDSMLLASVYLHLTGGRQRSLRMTSSGLASEMRGYGGPFREPRPHFVKEVEERLHRALLERLSAKSKKAAPVWSAILEDPEMAMETVPSPT